MNKNHFKLSGDELKYIGNLAISSLLLNLIVEFFNQGSLSSLFDAVLHNPLIFLYNSMIILFTLSFCLLFRHRTVVRSLVSILWIACGVTNMVLLSFRTTPFTAVDLKLISDAIPLLDTYLTPFQIVLIGIAVIGILIGLVICYRKIPKYAGHLNYLMNSMIIIVLLGITLLFTKIGVATNLLAVNFGNIGMAFTDYGFAYCFSNSLINTGISKPDNYSEETIQTIVDTAIEAAEIPSPTAEEETATEEETSSPNIIFLQLESFFDPTHVTDFTFSEDPCPVFRSLKENYTSGYLNVPSLGAGTANTEFEVITGMNLDFFGPGEYPYKTILKKTTCESTAYDLKELGYSTHAIHNNTATFYGRNLVFANLGFDTFTPVEYMQNVTKNALGWAKDENLISQIMETLNSTETSDYIYTISVQGHGKYPQDASSLYEGTSSADTEDTSEGTVSSDLSIDSSSLSNSITIDGIDEDRKFAFEYYVSQIKEMDTFIGNLIEQLEAYDEDVVLVMYGDHLPSLDIQAEDLDNGDLYQTEYVIWASDGLIDTVEDRDLQAYQLSAYTLQLLGDSPGLLTKLHQKELTAEANGETLTLEGFSDTSDNSSDTTDSSSDSTEINDTTDHTTNNSTSTTNDTTTSDEDTTSSSSSSSSSSSASADDDSTYLQELKLLQYDMLYGNQDCYGGINPFEATNLQYGVIPITIESVTQSGSDLLITGEKFTTYSHAEINGSLVETILTEDNNIEVPDTLLTSGDRICIVQLNKDEVELSRTDEYIVP